MRISHLNARPHWRSCSSRTEPAKALREEDPDWRFRPRGRRRRFATRQNLSPSHDRVGKL